MNGNWQTCKKRHSKQTLPEALALPSEARENNRINDLPEFLGRTSLIETQDVSDRLPKHLPGDLQERHIARLYRVPDATAATIARLAYGVAP